MLLISGIIVKAIGAVYKIPLTAYIGTVGRGYYAFAYNLVMPLHAVTMGAFPIALSKLVSKYVAKKDFNTVLSLKKGAIRLFIVVGFVGMLLLLICAEPYCRFVVKSPGSIYASFVVAPSLLFSCIGGAYRGYYEGLINMLPTAVSQVIEAVCKFVFGIAFAKIAYQRITDELFEQNALICDNDLSIVYPYSTAAAMLGVTLASFVSLAFLCLYSVSHKDSGKICDIRSAEKMLLCFAFPIMISSCVQSIFQFLDSTAVQLALNMLSPDLIREHYSSALSLVTVADSELSSYAYGVLSASLDFKNLVPGITMSLGICAVPVISSAFECSDKVRLCAMFNLIFKYTTLLSCLGGLVLYVGADDALTVLYANKSPDIVIACGPLIRMFALTVGVYSVSGFLVYSVQSIGMAQKSIPSYIVCGIIRVVLNILLINNGTLLLYGFVISSFVGYAVLAVWNLAVFVRYAGCRVDYVRSIFLPVLIKFGVILLWLYAFSDVEFSSNKVIDLLVKTVFASIIYLLPCFLCGLLKLNDIFCYFADKKNR